MANDSYAETKKELISDFNEAKLQVFRLNNSWERFSNAIRAGNFLGEKGANWELDDIFGELSTDAELKDESRDKKDRYAYKISKLNDMIADNKENDEAIYLILRMKEKVLRRLQDEAGKGSKRSSEDEDDIDT